MKPGQKASSRAYCMHAIIKYTFFFLSHSLILSLSLSLSHTYTLSLSSFSLLSLQSHFITSSMVQFMLVIYPNKFHKIERNHTNEICYAKETLVIVINQRVAKVYFGGRYVHERPRQGDVNDEGF